MLLLRIVVFQYIAMVLLLCYINNGHKRNLDLHYVIYW